MREDLVKKLYENYPSIFKHIDDSGEERLCTVDVGDGWYNIINNICSILLENEKAKAKWIEYRKKRGEEIYESEYEEPVKAIQIKEKFGGLRFYTTGGNEFSRGVIFMGEAMSLRTCEECGNVGSERKNGWIRVLCDEHESQRQWRVQDELRPKTILSDS